jgi:hypothetical protein
LVEEFYVRPVYGSPLLVDFTAMVGGEQDDISKIGEELEFSY